MYEIAVSSYPLARRTLRVRKWPGLCSCRQVRLLCNGSREYDHFHASPVPRQPRVRSHRDGTKVPKHHSKYIRAASAATASGSLETALSKVTRRSAFVRIPGVSTRVTSDRDLTFFVHNYRARTPNAGSTLHLRYRRGVYYGSVAARITIGGTGCARWWPGVRELLT